MNSMKVCLVGGFALLTATGVFGETYKQTGESQGDCKSIPSDLCSYQGPGVEITENDFYDKTTNTFTMKRSYLEGHGFKTTESIPLDGSWTPTTCYTINPATLSPIGNACGPNDSTVKVRQFGKYNSSDQMITITEHGALLLNKGANPKFPSGGSMIYTVKVTYAPK